MPKSDEEILEELNLLFSFSKPGSIRKSIVEIFFRYVISCNPLPENFEEIAHDVYFLLQFLECMEEME